MITITPNTVFGRVGAILSALIIVACIIGLTLSKDVYDGRPRRDFFCYFTNLSNLLVLFYFSLISQLLYARSALRRFIPIAEFSVTMCIALTHIVFHFLILPNARRYTQNADSQEELRIMAANTLFVHYIVPWLTIAYWLLCAPGKQTLPLRAALLWTIIPVAYAVLILLRAQSRGNIPGLHTPYPYPFLDIGLYGVTRVAFHCAGMFVCCVLLSGCSILLLRVLYAFFGGGKTFFLV